MADIYNNNTYISQQENNLVDSGFKDLSVASGDYTGHNVSQGPETTKVESKDSNSVGRDKQETRVEPQYDPTQRPPGTYPKKSTSWQDYRYPPNRKYLYKDDFKIGKQSMDWGSSTFGRKKRTGRGMAKPSQGRGEWNSRPKQVDSLQGQLK